MPALPRSETRLRDKSPQAASEPKTEQYGQFMTNANSENSNRNRSAFPKVHCVEGILITLDTSKCYSKNLKISD